MNSETELLLFQRQARESVENNPETPRDADGDIEWSKLPAMTRIAVDKAIGASVRVVDGHAVYSFPAPKGVVLKRS